MRNKKNPIIAASICLLVIMGVLFIQTDSYTMLKEWMFSNKDTERQRIAGYEKLADQVDVREDIVYNHHFKNSKLDVYMPKMNQGTPKPVIFWAHGGGYIAGDKKSVADYCVMLANQGYVIVNLNYSLAPEYEYPTPIVQIGEAYLYMISKAAEYDIDKKRVAFGGDSAGGQIMGQFVNVQVDDSYADMLELTPVVDDGTIKAVIFFSALLDLNKFDENKNEYANHVFDRLAQAYFGLENWKNSDKVNQANIIGNVSKHYPPTYLTDGNTASFQTQAKELADQLEDNNVPVTTTFFNRGKTELRHEYQFKMGTDAAIENYNRVTAFLNKYLGA